MKKLILLVIIILLTTACSFKESEYDNDTIYYNLSISNYYTENITFTFPKTAYDIAKANINSDYDSLEFILLIDNFSRPIHNNLNSYYEKNITRLKNAVEVDLKYDYIEEDFINSNYMTTCFENHQIISNDNFLEIHLFGEFYCLQDKTMTVEVESIYDNETSNGNKINDKYQWIIKPGKEKNIDIYYKVDRNKNQMLKYHGSLAKQKIDTDKITMYEYIIIFVVLVVGFFFYRFLYNREFNNK